MTSTPTMTFLLIVFFFLLNISNKNVEAVGKNQLFSNLIGRNLKYLRPSSLYKEDENHFHGGRFQNLRSKMCFTRRRVANLSVSMRRAKLGLKLKRSSSSVNKVYEPDAFITSLIG